MCICVLMCPSPAISQPGPAAEISLLAQPEMWMMQLGLAQC